MKNLRKILKSLDYFLVKFELISSIEVWMCKCAYSLKFTFAGAGSIIALFVRLQFCRSIQLSYSMAFERSDCTYRNVFTYFDCKLLQNRSTVDCSTVVQ